MAPRRPRKGAGRRYGDGSVYPRKGQDGRVVGYEAAVPLGDGRTIRRLAASPEAAEARRAQFVADRDAGVDILGGEQTVTRWAETWLTLKARELKPRTRDGYRGQIENYILPAIGAKPLRSVTAAMLQTLLTQLHDDIARHTSYSGARTAQAVAGLLDQLFDLAVKRRLITHNPMDGVIRASYKRARITPPSEAQLGAVLAHAHDTSMPPLWYLYGLLGVRRGEGIGLCWRDVDFAAGTVTIRQQVQATAAEGVYVGSPKNDAGERTLPAPAALLDLLRAWRPIIAARQIKAARWEDHDLVFPGRGGRPMWPSTVDHEWRRLREGAGLPATVKLHHVRHMVATLLDEAGATEALKADILGHEKANITQRYTHGRLAAMRRVLEIVAATVLRRSA